MSQSVVDVQNLRKSYKNFEALKGISFDIKRGEIIGLLGPNGAGKSTFFSILSTISSPSSGDILVDGISIKKDKNHIRSKIGYVPQEISLYPTLTCLDNLLFWANIYGIDNHERINKVISDMNLSEYIRRKVELCSGGIKRRLNIAVGILHNPEILIMDEPLVGVDVVSKQKILDVMVNLKNNGTSIIFSSHSIDEMKKICDRIVVLQNGEIKAVGSISELLDIFKVKNLEDILFTL